MFFNFEKIKQHAKLISAHSEYRLQLGAVIFKGNKIISTGFNKNKTHPITSKYFEHGSIHAEIDAMLHARPEKIPNSNIFVFREDKRKKPAMAKPCPMCVQLLFEVGIKNAFWTIPIFPFWDYAEIKNLYRQINKRKAKKINRY